MATGKHRALIEIDAKVAQANKKIGSLEKKLGKLEKQTNKSAKAADNARRSLEGMLTGAAIIQGVRTLDDMVQKSIKFENVMGNLKFPIDAAREATQGLVSDFDLAKSAVAATSLGVAKSEQDFAKLSRAAVALGSKLGIDATAAMEQLTTAVGRGSPRILDNFGIIAKGFESMNMEERLNLISEAMEDTTFTVSESAREWNALKNELDKLGNESLPLVVKGAGFAVDEINDLRSKIESLIDTGDGWNASVEDGIDLWLELQGQLIPSIELVEQLGERFKTTSDETANWVNQLIRARAVATGQLPDVVGMVNRALIESSTKRAAVVLGGTAAGAAANQAAATEIAKNQPRRGRRPQRRPAVESQLGRDADIGEGLHGLDLGGFQREQQAEQMERELELMQARQDSTAAIFDAEIALAEFRRDEHEAEILRLEKGAFMAEQRAKREDEIQKERIRAEREAMQQRKATFAAANQMMSATGQAFELLADQEGETGKRMAIAAAVAKGVQAMAVGAQITGEGVASIASQNYVQGALQIAAGATNFAIGGALMAKDVMGASARAQGGMGGGNSFGGGSGGGLGLQGGDFGGRGLPQGQSGSESQIPGSPSANPPAGGGGQSGGNTTINVQVSQTGSVDDESAIKIKQALENLDYSRGSVNA